MLGVTCPAPWHYATNYYGLYYIIFIIIIHFNSGSKAHKTHRQQTDR